MRDIKTETRLFEKMACLTRLGSAALSQVYICPARKTVLLIPHALAVAQQHDLLHSFIESVMYKEKGESL
jgi:hypothetical protein